MKTNESGRESIYRTIFRLENPNVRLEDNSSYVIGSQLLGILYSFFINTVPKHNSPGLLLFEKNDLLPLLVQGAQKRFQRATRDFLTARLGDLITRQATAEQLKEIYSSQDIKTFQEGTVEYLVAYLAKSNDFRVIGEKLKRGAERYKQRAEKRRLANTLDYTIEYACILDALQE